jgi:hypothetical protein
VGTDTAFLDRIHYYLPGWKIPKFRPEHFTNDYEFISDYLAEFIHWMTIDTTHGASASAIIYSIAETAKANKLKPYDYFEYLLTEIPKHMEDTSCNFCEDLLPWSPKLQTTCRK